MLIKELMTVDVRTCSEDDTLNAAAQMMWEGDVGATPIVDAKRRVVGMVTDRDIAMAAYTQGRPLWAIPVATAMTPHVVSCSPGDSVERAEEIMQAARVRRLPVVDGDGQLVGLISINDLARRASHNGHGAGAPTADDVGRTLGGICQHRQIA